MNNKIIIETSARHIHLSQADLETLFGEGYELTKKKDLSQPGQFACVEKVKVVGTRGEKAMSVLGPVRDYTQIELALTDARSLGLEAPVRGSGDLAGSGACKLVGPSYQDALLLPLAQSLPRVYHFWCYTLKARIR